jgi:hypothetical protein
MVTFYPLLPMLISLLGYAVVIFCVWKFYEVLSRINDNLAGIRRAIDDARGKAPGE